MHWAGRAVKNHSYRSDSILFFIYCANHNNQNRENILYGVYVWLNFVEFPIDGQTIGIAIEAKVLAFEVDRE